ncbi:MAG: M16 family metallopeptidase [Bacteroidia bacterium]
MTRVSFHPPPAVEIRQQEGMTSYRLPSVADLGKAIWYFAAPPSKEYPKGTRRMIAALLTEGTEDFSAEKYHFLLKRAGANVSFEPHAFGFFLEAESLASSWEEVVEIIRSVVRRALLPEAAFKRWKSQWLAQLARAQKESRWHADRLLSAALWDGTPYNAILLQEEIESLSYEAIAWYYQEVFQQALLAVVVSGDFSGDILPARGETLSYKEPLAWHEGLHTYAHQAEQVCLRVALPFFSFGDTLFPAGRLGLVVWGGHFGSRLMSRLREKEGWTYGVSARLHRTLHGNYVVVKSEVAAAMWQKALEAIKEEFFILAEQPIPEEEFQTALNYLLSTWQWESSWDLVRTYASYVSWGLPVETYTQWAEAFQSLDSATVRQAWYKLAQRIKWVEVASGAL